MRERLLHNLGQFVAAYGPRRAHPRLKDLVGEAPGLVVRLGIEELALLSGHLGHASPLVFRSER